MLLGIPAENDRLFAGKSEFRGGNFRKASPPLIDVYYASYRGGTAKEAEFTRTLRHARFTTEHARARDSRDYISPEIPSIFNIKRSRGRKVGAHRAAGSKAKPIREREGSLVLK